MASVQILLGMLVGFRMTREELVSGVHALLPASLLAAVMVSASIGAALIAARLTSLDDVTALFAAAPGGLTEMTAVSVTFGADGAAVATVQLVRVLLAVAVVDVLLSRFGPKGQPEDDSEDQPEPAPRDQEQDGASDWRTEYKEDLKHLAVAAPWGILGGVIGIATQVPAGGIIGALIGSALFRLLSERAVPVGKFQTGVQALSGVVIGLGASAQFLSQFARLAGAGALIISVQMGLWLAMSWVLVRFFDYDLPTAALAPSPGAISAVVTTAEDAGADTVVVTFIHLVRLTTVIVVVPVLVTVFFGR